MGLRGRFSLLVFLDSHATLLAPLGPPFDADPEHGAGEEAEGGDEGEAPAAAHGGDHLRDDGGAGGAHEAADQVAGRRRRRGAGRVQIDEDDGDDVEGARQRQADDEEQHEGHGQVGFALERPSVAQQRREARVQHRPDHLHPGQLDGEIAHVVPALDVDGEAGSLGDALVVQIHQTPHHHRGDGAGDSERNERQSCSRN